MSEDFAALFGEANEGFGVLMAATIGVRLYACGGGTIPLFREWLAMGMSMGSASAFMITGPATKITNLGALKSCWDSEVRSLHHLCHGILAFDGIDRKFCDMNVEDSLLGGCLYPI